MALAALALLVLTGVAFSFFGLAAGSAVDWYFRRHISDTVRVDAATGPTSAIVEVGVDNLAPASGQDAELLGSLRSSAATCPQTL